MLAFKCTIANRTASNGQLKGVEEDNLIIIVGDNAAVRIMLYFTVLLPFTVRQYNIELNSLSGKSNETTGNRI